MSGSNLRISSLCLGLPYVRLRPLDDVLRAAARPIGGVPKFGELVNSCEVPFIGFQPVTVSFIGLLQLLGVVSLKLLR